MINCPNCGGEVKLPVAAVPTASCAYCSSLLVVNEEAVRSLGQYALLTNPPSCLAVGWPGSLLKRHFTTMGRAQLSYKDGLWDEWWVAFDQNYRAWISQDEGGYILEKPVNPEEPIPSYKSLSPGDVITIGGINLQVEEKREAELVGAQGALPFQVIPGEKFRFVELSDGEKKCTIEYFPDGSHEVFVGKTLGPEDLKSSPKPPEQKLPYGKPLLKHPPPLPGTTNRKDKPAKAVDHVKAQNVSCPNCGGAVKYSKQHGTVMVVCQYCASSLDVSKGLPELVAKAGARQKNAGPIGLAARGRIKGRDYQIIGRVSYRMYDEGYYYWDEYQLVDLRAGFHTYLALENGHWVFYQPIRKKITIDPRLLHRKYRFTWENNRYIVFERADAEVTYVEGELTWVAKVGDSVSYAEAVAPPYALSAEWNKEELEWLKGTYLHPETVERAFRLPQGTLHQPMGVHACQPFERSKGTKTNILLGMGFAALFALLLFYSFGKSGTLVGRYTISPDDYLSQDGFLSAPFKIADGDHNFRIVTRAPVRGRWVASSIGFVDEKDNVLMNVDQTMEQYSGYEGGEYWSEGSGSDSALFRMSGGQSYRLIAFGESASWPRVGSGNAPPFYVEIYQDVIPKRYFAMALVLALILPALEIWRRERFRAAKWGDDEEDD